MLLSSTQTKWQLRLLGGASLYCPDLKKDQLERKQAALLTILALDGTQTRSKIAGLLWANSTESTARNNLAQVLKRLKEFTGSPIILGDQALHLINTTTDVVQLEEHIFARRFEQISTEMLLAGYDFEDCPDFLEWLVFQRERLSQLVLQGLEQYALELEQQQQLPQALEIAERILMLDQVSEHSYRRIMRLHYALGQRSAALKTFERCLATIAKELGVQLSIETLHLKSQIEADNLVTAVQRKAELPLSILRPKHLIGRENDWQTMQQAWRENKAIFIHAAPGIGKTRLIQDFAATYGQPVTFQSHPGDQNLAYSFLARVCNSILKTYQLELPEWVRLELSRILPQLSHSDDHLKALQSQADQLRFYQAAAEINRLAIHAGMNCVIVDDLQFSDNATFDVVQFVLSQLYNTKFNVLMAYRSGALSPEITQLLEQMIQANLAVQIELEPFTIEQTHAFLNDLELEIHLEPTILHTYTNGNPLYMLESIRYCLENNQALQHAPRIKSLIIQRLENLPDKALRLAQVAAIMNTDFQIERAAKILEQPILELTTSLALLETNQIMQGEQFLHDLIFEAVLTSLSPAIKRHLHRQIASVLTQADLGDAGAIRIAEHYISGGENNLALIFLERAAIFTNSQYRMKETAEIYVKKARIENYLSDINAVFSSYEKAYDNLALLGVSDTLNEIVQALLSSARTPDQHASALIAQSTVLLRQGEYPKAIEAALKGLLQANLTSSVALQAKLENTVGTAYWYHQQLELALPHLEKSLALNQSLIPDMKTPAEAQAFQQELGVAMQSIAICYDQLGKNQIAAKYHLESINIFKTLGHQIFIYKALGNYSTNLRDQGYYQKAHLVQIEADSLVANNTDLRSSAAHHRIGFSKVRTVLGMYDLALQTAHSALALAQEFNPSIAPIAISRVVSCLRNLGQFTQAQNHLQEAEQKQINLGHHGLLEQCYLEQWQGRLQICFLQKLEQQNWETLPRERRLQSQLLLSEIYAPQEALEQTYKIIAEADKKHLLGFSLAAKARAAAALLKLGQNSKALEYSQAALQIPDGISPEIPLAEILWIHRQALQANANPHALEPLQQALELITDQQKALPLEYQESFVTNNPINKAIIEAAQALGIQ